MAATLIDAVWRPPQAMAQRVAPPGNECREERCAPRVGARG